MASKAKTAAAPVKRVGKTIDDFRSAHDKGYIVPKKIEAALKILGPDSWEYEGPFAEMAGVALKDMPGFRDQPQYLKYQVWAKATRSSGGTPKIVWCGSVALAKMLGGPRELTAE